jgi:predicted signal transduction protein with EAL and GGDEF domain
MKSYIETLVRWAAPQAGGLPKRPANFITTVETGKLVLQGAQPLIEQTPAPASSKWWSKDARISKTTEELELMIREAVKAAPGCEAFVGVVIERVTPKSRLDANWEIRGIRFGGMDRQIAREALTPIVQRMQGEFRLPERLIKSLSTRPTSPDQG